MLDWNHINTLQDDIGPDAFAEIVDLFLEEVDDAIAALQDQTGPADLGAALHFVKGCALNLGFSEFAALCQQTETRISAGDHAPADLTQLLDCYARSRAQFLAELPARVPGYAPSAAP